MTRTDSVARSWFRSLNCDARYGATLFAVQALLWALGATGEWGRTWLAYDRDALARGQWWRLLSAHLVHLSWQHLALNAAGLALLWALFARCFSPRRWLWIALVAAVCIDAGLWWRAPEVQWYVGLSGVLHAALAAGAVAFYRRGEGMGAALLLLLIVKLIYEQRSGASVFEPSLPLIPQAHLYGALGGVLGAFVPRSSAKSL